MKITIAGKVFEVDNEELSRALEDKKESISIESDHVIRTKEEEDTFKENIKDEKIKIGEEIGVKRLKEALGVKVEGKNPEKIAEAFKEKVISESNISIDEKEKKWKTDLQTLKDANTRITGELEAEKNGRLGVEKKFKIERHIDKLMPDTLRIPKDDMTLILSNKYDFDISEDGQFVAKDKMTGKVLQNDATLSPTPFKEVINGFFEKNPDYLTGVEGGAAGGDSGGSGKTTIEAYTKTLNEAGHDTNSESFNAEMQKAIDAKTVSLED